MHCNSKLFIMLLNIFLAGDEGCVITEPLMVRPFNGTPSYSFRGTCELIAVMSCTSAVQDFSVRVDFISDTTDNGAVGVFKDGFSWVSREDGSFSTTSEEEPIMEGDGMLYEASDVTVMINESSDTTTISVGDGILATITHSYGGKV